MRMLADNPEVLRTMMQSNPAIQRLIQSNPQFAEVFNNPQVITDAMRAMSNPVRPPASHATCVHYRIWLAQLFATLLQLAGRTLVRALMLLPLLLSSCLFIQLVFVAPDVHIARHTPPVAQLTMWIISSHLICRNTRSWVHIKQAFATDELATPWSSSSAMVATILTTCSTNVWMRVEVDQSNSRLHACVLPGPATEHVRRVFSYLLAIPRDPWTAKIERPQ
jgi:hypothetical protein